MRPFLKKALDATSEELPFLDGDEIDPNDWSRDGKWIAFGGRDVIVASAIDPAKRFAFLKTPFNEGGPRFSPDGKWMAYTSDETGRYEECTFARLQKDQHPLKGRYEFRVLEAIFLCGARTARKLDDMSGDFTLYTVNTTELGRSTGMPLASRLFRARPGTLPMSLPMRGSLFGYNYDTHDGKQFLINCAVEPPG